MRAALVPYAASAPAAAMTGGAGGGFVQGFVTAGCVSAFQDCPSPAGAADLKRVLRHALQGGAALAAGRHAALAMCRRDYTRALAATAAGAVGVLLIERLLRDSAHAAQEKKDV
jgi:hypothetical protein